MYFVFENQCVWVAKHCNGILRKELREAAKYSKYRELNRRRDDVLSGTDWVRRTEDMWKKKVQLHTFLTFPLDTDKCSNSLSTSSLSRLLSATSLDASDNLFLNGSTGVLISPQPDLLPGVFCLIVRIFRLMLVLLYIYIMYICIVLIYLQL